MSEKRSTLETIQLCAKIAKIISRIGLIFCRIGGALCGIGIVALKLFPKGFQLGNTTIHGLVEVSDKVSLGTAYTAMAVGLIMCIGGAIVSKCAYSYFSEELEDGTPFTFRGAKSLFRLGLFTMIVPVATQIAASITYGIMSSLLENVEELDLSDGTSIVLGLVFLVMSFLCKYGAEQEGKN